VGIPADFNLITSRTWRIANLSVGIQAPLRKAERSNRIGAIGGLVTPGDITSEWLARSFRNDGPHRAESARALRSSLIVVEPTRSPAYLRACASPRGRRRSSLGSFEVVAEAPAKRPDTAARSVLPKADRERVDYEALAIKAFRKVGYA
jgi:hypothetical protein